MRRRESENSWTVGCIKIDENSSGMITLRITHRISEMDGENLGNMQNLKHQENFNMLLNNQIQRK